MKIDACIKKITKYLASGNAQPLLVNVQNSEALDKVLTHFNVGENVVINASEFCNKDELPRIETVLNEIATEKKNCFLVGLTSFMRFLGEEEIKKSLTNIINMTILKGSTFPATATSKCLPPIWQPTPIMTLSQTLMRR